MSTEEINTAYLEILEEVSQEVFSFLDPTKPDKWNPSKAIDKWFEIFEDGCKAGGRLDPRQEQKRAEKVGNLCWTIGQKFLNLQIQFAPIEILLKAWNTFGAIQKEEKIRIYRASIAMNLMNLYIQLNQRGLALRWGLHTFADDVLGKHPNLESSVGLQRLKTTFGLNSQTLEALKNSAQEGIQDWSLPEAFAEDVVLRFATKHSEYSSLFSIESHINEFPFSPAYYSTLLTKLKGTEKSKKKKAKGEALEHLASYLCLLLPGWVPTLNKHNQDQSFESDLVVRNVDPNNHFMSALFGRHFLVECKNWRSAVGVSSVGYFLYRMRLTGVQFGIMFASSGITGVDEKAAKSLVNKSYHRDGNVCIVITKKDLQDLENGEQSFSSLLLDRIEMVRF